MLEIPDYQRRTYEKTNLSRVVFQWRFSPILRLRQGLSPDLQERWRQTYPIYESRSYKLEGDRAEVGKAPALAHRLADADVHWEWDIREDSLTFICNQYSGWEQESEHFESFARSFWEEYEPAYISRVGLRYQDVLERLGESSPAIWQKYLRSELSGWFANGLSATAMRLSEQQLFLDHEAGTIRLGLEAKTGHTYEGEPAQRLDMDFDMFRAGLKDDFGGAWERMEAFHDALVGLFEWTITDELRDEMSVQGEQEAT